MKIWLKYIFILRSWSRDLTLKHHVPYNKLLMNVYVKSCVCVGVGGGGWGCVCFHPFPPPCSVTVFTAVCPWVSMNSKWLYVKQVTIFYTFVNFWKVFLLDYLFYHHWPNLNKTPRQAVQYFYKFYQFFSLPWRLRRGSLISTIKYRPRICAIK